jgi:hypothetical protein
MDASWLKSLSVTGNMYLDTLILAHLVPLLLSYASSLTSGLSAIMTTIWAVLCHYIGRRLSQWAFGTVVCTISVTDKEYMFKVLQETIFGDPKYQQPVLSANWFASLLEALMDGDNWTNLSGRIMVHDYGGRYYKATLGASEMQPLQVTPLYYHEKVEQRTFAFVDQKTGMRFRLTVKQLGTILPAAELAGKNNDNNSERSSYSIQLSLRAFGMSDKIMELRSSADSLTNVLNTFLCRRFTLTNRLHFTYMLDFGSCDNMLRLRNYVTMMNTGFIHKLSDTSCYPADDSAPDVEEQQQQKNQDEQSTNQFSVKFSRNLRVGISHAEAINISPIVSEFSGQDVTNVFFWMQRYFPELLQSFRTGHLHTYMFFREKCVVIITQPTESLTMGLRIVSLKGVLTKKQLVDIVSFLFDAVLSARKEESNVKKCVHIHKYADGSWKREVLDKREMSGLFLTPSVEKNLISEIDNFVSLRPLYNAVQLSYKLGILLYGPPGTGKTTAIKTIAYEWQMDVYQLDVNDPTINDHTIVKILNSLGSSSQKIVVLEDIDAAFADKEKVAQETRVIQPVAPNLASSVANQAPGSAAVPPKFLTYSGLLQALDGLCSNQSGVITILSTNHIKKLGGAILREGRIDVRIYMGPCCRQQIEKMASHFIHKRLELSELTSVGVIENLEEKITTFADRLCVAAKAASGVKVSENDAKSPDDESQVKPCQLQNYIMSRIVKVTPIFDDYEQLLFSITEKIHE